MRNQGLILLGSLVIAAGLLFLIGAVFHVDVGTICWPVGLIALGVWILLRPVVAKPGTALGMSLFGPVRRDGAWQVTPQEIWLFIGDVRLDFTQAQIPPGETPIRVFSFVGDVKAYVPEGVGVSVSSTAFINDVRLLGQRREGFLSFHLQSDGYEVAERKIRLEPTCFVADVRVERG